MPPRRRPPTRNKPTPNTPEAAKEEGEANLPTSTTEEEIDSIATRGAAGDTDDVPGIGEGKGGDGDDDGDVEMVETEEKTREEEETTDTLRPRQFYTDLPGTEDLQNFLSSLDQLKPAIPDEVAAYYLRSTGFNCRDQRVLRLVALAAQKFISEVCSDSMQYCKIRQQSAVNRDLKLGTPAAKAMPAKDKPYILTQEDLASSLQDYGITIRKPEYYTDEVDLSKEGPSRVQSSTGSIMSPGQSFGDQAREMQD